MDLFSKFSESDALFVFLGQTKNGMKLYSLFYKRYIHLYCLGYYLKQILDPKKNKLIFFYDNGIFYLFF